MHVLLCNDDGIHAEGIRALAETFRDAGHRVTVSAPDRERSAASHALTMMEPLYVTPCPDWMKGVKAFAVSGTPADCCGLGLASLAEEPVDLVVSGINQGPNLGSDTLYSGTVAAAMEGALHGWKAMAVSLVDHTARDFRGACRLALKVAGDIVSEKLAPCAVYNLNVPALPPEQVKGPRLTDLALMRYVGGYEKRTSPFGREYYWLRSTLDDSVILPDTDLALIREGYATLTPLGWKLTCRSAAQAMIDGGGLQDGTV